MKKITLILAHLVLVFGLITAMPVIKSPSNQVFAVIIIDEAPSGATGDHQGPDDNSGKPSSGPKEEPKESESKSVVSSVWGWIKKLVS